MLKCPATFCFFVLFACRVVVQRLQTLTVDDKEQVMLSGAQCVIVADLSAAYVKQRLLYV